MILKRMGADSAFTLYDALLKVGSSLDDDDILVEEQGVTPTQCRFIFVDNQIILQEGHVWVDGQLVTQFPKTVQAGQVISLNDDVHLVYGEEGFEMPVAPKLVHPVKEVTEKTVDITPYVEWVRAHLTWIVVALLAMGAVWGTQTVATRYFTNTELVAVPVDKPDLNEDYIETYIRRVVGENILSYEEVDGVITVRVLEGTSAQEQRWQEDISRLLIRLEDDNIKIIFEIVRVLELVNSAKKQIAYMPELKDFKVLSEGRTVKIVGVALPRIYIHVKESIQQVAKDNPDLTIVNEVHELAGADFEIVSLTISRNNASAMVRRQGQTHVIHEGGDVFGAGVLKLIRHNGVVLATRWGDVFVPWRLS